MEPLMFLIIVFLALGLVAVGYWLQGSVSIGFLAVGSALFLVLGGILLVDSIQFETGIETNSTTTGNTTITTQQIIRTDIPDYATTGLAVLFILVFVFLLYRSSQLWKEEKPEDAQDE